MPIPITVLITTKGSAAAVMVLCCPSPEWLILLSTFASVGRPPLLAAFRPRPLHFASVSLLWRLFPQNAATLSSVRHVGMSGSIFTKKPLEMMLEV